MFCLISALIRVLCISHIVAYLFLGNYYKNMLKHIQKYVNVKL